MSGVLGVLLEDFNPAQPRGFHGHWIRVGDHHELRVFHGDSHLGNVAAGPRTHMMIGVGKVVGGAGRTISTGDIGGVVDRALRQFGPEGPRVPEKHSPPEPRWKVGDLVMHEHGFLGPRPATVTKVTKERVHIRHQDASLRPTSMTHNQAAVRLRHQNLDEARAFARQRLGVGEYAKKPEAPPLAPFSNARRSALPRGERPATAEQRRQLDKVLVDIQSHTPDYTTAQRVMQHHLARANVTRADALSSREHSLLLKDLRGLAKHGPSALESVSGAGIGVLLGA